MFNKQTQRCLSFLLALVMVYSLIPISALASETDNQATTQIDSTEVSEPNPTETEEVTATESSAPVEDEEENPTESSEPSPEETKTENSSAVAELQDRVDEILLQYGISDEMTDKEIANAIIGADGETVKATMDEMDAIDADAPALTEEERLALELDLYERFRNVWDSLFFAVPAVEVTGVSGVTVTCDSNGSISESSGTVTATVTGSFTTRKTTTITVTNTSGSTAAISFDYSASNYDTSESGGWTLSDSASGTWSGNLTADAILTFNLRSKRWTNSTTATATLSNFSVVIAATEYDVDLSYDTANGSVTKDGTAAAPGTHSIASAELKATANSGSLFLGWINPTTGEILSTDSTYNVVATQAMSIKAVFASNGTTTTNTPWFKVNSTHLFDDLTSAAGMSGASTVVLMNNGTLPALKDEDGNDIENDYTIPAGVTLLIPFDSANTLYTTKPASTGTTYTKPTAYRTLTMASGANITVNGAISLSGKYKSGSGGTTNTGAPSGPTSFVKMQEGSSITLNSGGALYCYGFITGSGSVTAKSGSTVYELFQFQDWRGGDETTGMKNGVFPISQYYVQNVEVPLELQAGSTCYGFTSVTVSILGEQSASVKVFGPSGSMFNITSGSLTKRYDGATDRVIYEIDGTIDLANVKISMGIYNVDSADYDLAINNNITVQINSGSTVNITKDVALLPGTEIIIEQGATCALGSGVNLYVYDVDEWGGYCGTYDAQYIAVTYAPGRTGSRAALDDAKILIKGIADASAGYVYTTAGGANICGEEGGVIKVNPGTQTVTYQYKDQANEYPEIPITSAQLKHGDGSYADTSAEAATYHYAHGVWHKTKEKPVITQVAAKAASCDSVGWNAYEYCSTCDYTTYDEIAALGHSYDEGVYTAPADYTVNGCTTYTCTACSDSYTEDLDLFNIYATNIRAGDGLDIYFYVKVSDLEDTDYVAKITRTKAGVMDSTVDVPFSEWTAYGTDYMRFSYSGIAAKEMTDEIYVSIYDGDGIQVCAVQVESVARYALRTLGTEKTELNTALVDMLNYGAAAQNSFSYNTADLANAGLSDTQTGFATESTTYTNEGLSQGEGLAAASVSAKNKLMLTFYYYTDLETNGYTAYISYTDHYGAEHTPTVSTFRRGTLSETNEAGETVSTTVYGVDVTGLAIADGRRPITCVIKDGNENVISTSICSIENYIAATIEQANENSTTPDPVYELLMKFVDSAYAYFH